MVNAGLLGCRLFGQEPNSVDRRHRMIDDVLIGVGVLERRSNRHVGEESDAIGRPGSLMQQNEAGDLQPPAGCLRLQLHHWHMAASDSGQARRVPK
jgi:hypothetical protein